MTDRIDLIVSVDEAHLERIHEVAHRLERAGMRVDELQEETGTLTGRASEDVIPVLEAVPGVAAVERARPVRAV